MIHYDRTSWADYARGLLSETQSSAMRGHLAAGCRPCAKTLTIQQAVVSLADADRTTAAPDFAVRQIKGFFALNRPERRSLLAPIALSLLWDSGLEPVRAGVRGGCCGERQVLYESDEYGLDLRISPLEPSCDGVLTGILAKRSGAPVGRVPAYLVVDDRVVAQAISDEAGQFELPADFDRRTELWLEIGSTKRIAVAVDPVH